MSTTVNYKGNTIATLSNETKTLTTAGTWVEADVVITDTSSGIVPSGTINIDDDGTYDVTNYVSAEVAIDYESKLRAITFVVNRNSDDTTVARSITVHQTFSAQINFSNGIKTIGSSIIIYVGDTTATRTLYVPKSRPIIVLGASATIGNFDVVIDSSYGECIDVPHILGASNTYYTKAVYLKANAPDEFTVTINLNSQATYPDTVLLNSLSVTSNGTYTATSGTAYSSVNVEVEPNLQAKSNISPTTSSQTITADSEYDGLSSVQINAMPSGTAGTPSATKGTVSNHQVSITPSVTNTTGYITGGTKTGTAVTVTASELASGNKEITSNGTNIDVVGYSTVSVAVSSSTPSLQAKTNISPTTSSQTITADSGYDGLSSVQINAMPSGTAGTPTATKGSVSNHSVSVTPSVINTTGYIAGGTKTGTAVTVTAAELASGNKEITSNGTNIDVVGYSTVSVAVPSSGGVNVKKGTYTPTQTYSSTGNRAIVAVSEIGFTPSRFVLYVKNIDDISTTQYAMIRTTFETYGSTDIVIRNSVRFLDSSGSVGSSVNNTSWTTQTNYYLYLNNGTIYYRTTNTYTLRANVNYIWEAYE